MRFRTGYVEIICNRLFQEGMSVLPNPHSARLHVQVGGLDFPALSLVAEEALSRPCCHRLEVLVPEGFSPVCVLGLPVRIEVRGPYGRVRTLCGIASAFEQKEPHPDGRACYEMTVESVLVRLRRQSDTRIFLQQSLPAIVQAVLGAHGIEGARLCLSHAYPVRPWTLQVGESDLDFLQRLLAKAGIFYWSEATEQGERLCFSDHNAHLPERPGAPLRYQPGSGLEPQNGSIHRLRVREQLVPTRFEVQEKSLSQPSQRLHAQAKSGTCEPLRHYRFAAGAAHLDEAQHLARLAAEEAGARRMRLQAQSDLADICAGQIVPLDAAALSPRYSGDYLVSSVRLNLSQRAGQQGAGADLALNCEATLVPRATPFRPPQPPGPKIPFTFSARIESTGLLAELDEQGRTQARAHFDQSSSPQAQASIPLRRLSPYAGAPGTQPSGLHLPLHEGAEVLLSCLNNDPDRPVLIGALPNPATPSPVTSANRSQNLLRTAADNQLLMDDTREQEVIRLSTFACNNILELNAAALGRRIALASRQGVMQVQARKTQKITCGDTLTEHSGNDRRHAVENRHATRTRTAEIHHQAATDQRHQAAANLHLESARNTELSSAQHLRIDVARGQKFSVRGPDATFSVQNGAIHIQAAKDIEIRGQGGGDLTFAQNGGGFIVTADGRVNIYGKTVTLGGQGGVRLNGPTNYQIGAAPGMPAAGVAAALKARPIHALAHDGEPCILDPAWGRSSVPLGEAAEALFTVKNFRGGEAGEVRIFEVNAEGGGRQVDQIHFTLDDGFGPYRLPWQRRPEQVRDDLINDTVAQDAQPLTYVFEVAVGTACSARSHGLNLTTTLIYSPRDWEGRPLPDGGVYHLVDASGRRHASQIREGEVTFEDVLVGPWQLLADGEPMYFEVEE